MADTQSQPSRQAPQRGFWYLATPYSRHPGGVDAAHKEACEAAAICFRAGIQVFSPIAHAHAIAMVGQMDGHFGQWATFDRIMIGMSAGMIVVEMDGFSTSVGIAAEIALAESLGKPVVFMTPGIAPAVPIEMGK